MAMKLEAAWTHKEGNRPSEYEDAFLPDKLQNPINFPLAIAVTDGATEGAYSKQWANILCDCFIKDYEIPDEGEPRSWSTARLSYDRWVIKHRQEREGRGFPVKWYEAPSLSQGAFAAFLGLTIHENENGSYLVRSIACGDTCLFHMRESEMYRSFPMKHSTDFGFRPWLVSSRSQIQEEFMERSVQTDSFDIQPSDVLYLATDAGSQWFLEFYESGQKPSWVLDPFWTGKNNKTKFTNWIQDLRRHHRMRNDDTTFLRLSF